MGLNEMHHIKSNVTAREQCTRKRVSHLGVHENNVLFELNYQISNFKATSDFADKTFISEI